MYTVPAYTDISHFRAPYKDSLMGLGALPTMSNRTSMVSSSGSTAPTAQGASRGSQAGLTEKEISDQMVAWDGALSAAALNMELGADTRRWADQTARLTSIAQNQLSLESMGAKLTEEGKRAVSWAKGHWPFKTDILLDSKSPWHKAFQLNLVALIAKRGEAQALSLRDSFSNWLRAHAVFNKAPLWNTDKWISVDNALSADFEAAKKLAAAAGAAAGAGSAALQQKAAQKTGGSYTMIGSGLIGGSSDVARPAVTAADAPPVVQGLPLPLSPVTLPSPVKAEAEAESHLPWPLIAAGVAAGAGVILLATRKA